MKPRVAGGRLEGARRGQIFSIDALFALLPIMMILGAALQYLYLAEEHSTSIAQNSRLDTLADGMSGYVMGNFFSSRDSKGNYKPYDKLSKCTDLEGTLGSYAAQSLPAGYAYYAKAYSYSRSNDICKSSTDALWSAGFNYWSLIEQNNTASSDMRFMVEFDNSTKKPMPGNLTSLSFSVWKNVP